MAINNSTDNNLSQISAQFRGGKALIFDGGSREQRAESRESGSFEF
ncbi:hypothetical protein [Chroococcidiopsis sp.]